MLGEDKDIKGRGREKEKAIMMAFIQARTSGTFGEKARAEEQSGKWKWRRRSN